MNTVMRSLIVWLLLLALPFQGVAAARMLPSASAPAPRSVPHAPAVVKSCHDMAATAAVDGDHRHKQDKQDKHGSVCGDCCIVVALVPVPLVPPAFAPPSVAIPFRAGHAASADPSLLERPPRRLVA